MYHTTCTKSQNYPRLRNENVNLLSFLVVLNVFWLGQAVLIKNLTDAALG